MSSCFFSSRLKMRISAKSEVRKRDSTALPNEPVPPVMRRTLSLNMGISVQGNENGRRDQPKSRMRWTSSDQDGGS